MKYVPEDNSAVAVYERHAQAEHALKELQRSGFDMTKLSIIGRDDHTEEQLVGYYCAGGGMRRWGVSGSQWGRIWGLLLGSAFFAVPGIGPVLVGGPLVAWIISALEEAVMFGGLSAIGAGLYSIGIPKDSVLQYEAALKAGQFVVVAHGTANEVEQARRVMGTAGPVAVDLHPLQPQSQPEVVMSR